ncbi:MAG: hypothetical protein J6C51_06180 [Clostridia bacterium]|nr:hypothetical protein [Clostridia bacterium]
MISIIPEKTWAYNDADMLPTEGVPDGQTALNKDTGALVIFDLPSKAWKPI